MCGIAGILRVAPIVSPEVAIPDRWLDALDAPIARRGPDDAGRWRTRSAGPEGSIAHVALIHRRMAILDLAGGRQPMVIPARGDGAGEVAVTFNGCIYNHRDLRKELQGLGHTFTTDHSDTEVILHGHREWGRGMHDRLEGMYAAGVWDASERTLVLMRDLAGEKPLYYADLHPASREQPPADGPRRSVLIAFASSASAVLALLREMRRDADAQPWSDAERGALDNALAIDPESMRHWIALGWNEGTPWAGIKELKPGQVIWFDSLGRSGRRRLSIEAEANRSLPLDAPSAWTLIQRAVQQRLEADVPLGCFLSGGIDSGLVAGAAQAALAQRGERLKTFTMRMPDAAYDESELAASTARRLGTEHTTLDVEQDPARDVVDLIEWIGLPFGDSSLLPTYWLSRAVRGSVRVALSGDGGDELFAGYERHAAAPWLKRWRVLLQIAGIVPWPRARSRSVTAKVARLCDAARGAGYADLVATFPTRLMRQLVSGGGPGAGFEVPPTPQLRDLETYLPGDLLRKVDSASMRVALEVRAPLLDRELVFRAAATPPAKLMPGGKRKGMLRGAARGILPDEVLAAKKSGFAIPINAWFRTQGPLREMLHGAVRDRDAFQGLGVEIDMRFVERMLRQHDAGTHDHAQRLYSLMSLAVWNRWRGRP